MEAGTVKRVDLLGVPVDECDLEGALKAIERFLMDGAKHQIVLLDRRVLFLARRNSEYRRCLRDASLILPVSGGIVRAARFLGSGRLTRFVPFEFIIRSLAQAEKWNRSVYLLGATKPELEKAERNLRDSFPGLMIIGRYSGYYSRQMEPNIVLAIKKASPTFLLAGDGVPGRELWILKNKKHFNPGIYLWEGTCMNVFSGKIRRQRPRGANPAPDSLAALLGRPWRIVPLLYFWLLVLIDRLLHSRRAPAARASRTERAQDS